MISGLRIEQENAASWIVRGAAEVSHPSSLVLKPEAGEARLWWFPIWELFGDNVTVANRRSVCATPCPKMLITILDDLD